MKITLNEKKLEIPTGTSLFALKEKKKPDADILIVNGGVIREDCPLSEGDFVVLIKRGEIPQYEELEALIVARHTPGVHEKVKKSTVGIAGLGGLGSSVAIALTRVGVGKLILVDFDIVEPSNLNRQQYFIDQLGTFKTQALKANLERINPYIQLEIHSVRLNRENVPSIFACVDVLIEAFDTPEAKAMIIEAFTTAYPQKPLVMATGLAGYYSNNAIQTMQFSKNVYVVGDLLNAAAPGTGLMAPRVGIAAHHQANAALQLLLGEKIDS